MKKISSIIASGGNGSRTGLLQGKQLFLIKNKPLLYYTIKKLRPLTDEIILVIRKQDIEKAKLFFQKKYKKTAFVDKIVSAGKTRLESVKNGLKEVDKDCDIVLIHDGARPFFEKETVLQGIKKTYKSGACILAVPVKDTIKKVIKDKIFKTIKRENLYLAQTPQIFKAEIIKKAYAKVAEKDLAAFTDDSSLVEKILGLEVEIVNSSYQNFKITSLEDMQLAEILIKSKN